MIHNIINNTVHIESLVNPVRKARFKSPLKKKKKRFLEDVDEEMLKGFKTTTIYCEPQPWRERCFFSFSFSSPDISPHACATH